MRESLKEFVDKHQYSEPMTMALKLFAEDELPNEIVLNENLRPFGLTIENLRQESLGVVFDFIEDILEDNILTRKEMETIILLKKYLRIKEGDFLKYHKEYQIQEIIYQQMQAMLADLYVDRSEAIMKTDLQKLFDLSYDQFLYFEKRAVEEALHKGASIEDLDTIYKE